MKTLKNYRSRIKLELCLLFSLFIALVIHCGFPPGVN